jgi:hypothetical protein
MIETPSVGWARTARDEQVWTCLVAWSALPHLLERPEGSASTIVAEARGAGICSSSHWSPSMKAAHHPPGYAICFSYVTFGEDGIADCD